MARACRRGLRPAEGRRPPPGANNLDHFAAPATTPHQVMLGRIVSLEVPEACSSASYPSGDKRLVQLGVCGPHLIQVLAEELLEGLDESLVRGWASEGRWPTPWSRSVEIANVMES